MAAVDSVSLATTGFVERVRSFKKLFPHGLPYNLSLTHKQSRLLSIPAMKNNLCCTCPHCIS